ncbi:hypothetical protein [Oscillatoria sp. FACHB-1406]|uniref:hypothetical protein n=1 Tax=Oscillatoria sp. FACHB-1406 TaxID=2692846 RepID=UPI00168604C8|nr:hypothetical protein [Oscillatoria sp. FACHB-1406]MBD2576139.1 hypothetical protein [Oscillatoria sp. FACHB-1406]
MHDRSHFERNSASPQRNTSSRWQLLHLWSIAALLLIGTTGLGTKWLFRHWSASSCQTILPMTSDSERLYCIQVAAESGDLEALLGAIDLVGSWDKSHPLYVEGQTLLRDWSSMLFNLAQHQLNTGRLEAALDLTDKIPVKSPLYPEARLAIAAWQQEWQRGEQTVAQFETALQHREWKAAMKQIEGFSTFKIDYWRKQRAIELLTRLGKEKEATTTLQMARDLAQTPNSESLAEAIALAKKVDSSTYVGREAKSAQTLWSRTLLQMTAERLQQEDYAGAIATAKAIPQGDALYQEAQDWIALSRASESAQKNDVKAILLALETVRKIDPHSPLFAQAQTRVQVWQAKIQG